MPELARHCAHGEGKKHYVEMIQKPKYIVVRRGYKSVAYQKEVDSGT